MIIKNISKSIFHIGVDDASLDLFEAQYHLPYGMSYNSYLIIDSRIAVLDTVDARCSHQWRKNLEAALDGKTPDYLVVHHMEPDHSSDIRYFLDRYPEAVLVASSKAISMLPQFFDDMDFSGRVMPVGEGDLLDLGGHRLRFYSAPMVHWPEVMVSYEEYDKILFSADAFGKFGIIDSNNDNWVDEARRYYINIVGKYGNQVQMLLKKLSALSINGIAPLHGPVLSGDISKYLHLYDLWSSYKPENPDGVLVAYASIYGGTAEAANVAAAMLRECGVETEVRDLCRCDMSEAVAQAFRMGRMIIASATYDAGIFTPMHDFLYRLKIKGYRNRCVGIMENGTWAPIAAKAMREMLEPLKGILFVDESVTLRSRMHRTDIEEIRHLTDALMKL